MVCIEMRLKKSGNVVKVYDITNGVATIFNPEMYIKNNNGWDQVALKRLVPMEYPVNNDTYITQTTKNKAKKRMHLEDAVWKTSDGELWKHENIDDAIAHEIELMEKENNKGEE